MPSSHPWNRWHWLLSVLWLISLQGACRRETNKRPFVTQSALTKQPPYAAPTASPPATAPLPAASRSSTEVERPLDKLHGPALLLPEQNGAVLLSTWQVGPPQKNREASEKSEIDWRRVDADGKQIGPTLRLRITSGEVAELVAVHVGELLAVGWCSRKFKPNPHPAPDEQDDVVVTDVLGLVWVDSHGAVQGKVVEFDGECGLHLFADGNTVLALYPSGYKALCPDPSDSGERYKCPSVDLRQVYPGDKRPVLLTRTAVETRGESGSLGSISGFKAVQAGRSLSFAARTHDVGFSPIIWVTLFTPPGPQDKPGNYKTSSYSLHYSEFEDLLYTGDTLILMHRSSDLDRNDLPDIQHIQHAIFWRRPELEAGETPSWSGETWPVLRPPRLSCAPDNLRAMFSLGSKQKTVLDSKLQQESADWRAVLGLLDSTIQTAAWTGNRLLVLRTDTGLTSAACQNGSINLKQPRFAP